MSAVRSVNFISSAGVLMIRVKFFLLFIFIDEIHDSLLKKVNDLDLRMCRLLLKQNAA